MNFIIPKYSFSICFQGDLLFYILMGYCWHAMYGLSGVLCLQYLCNKWEAKSLTYCILWLFMALVSTCCLSFLARYGGGVNFPMSPGLEKNPAEQFWGLNFEPLGLTCLGPTLCAFFFSWCSESCEEFSSSLLQTQSPLWVPILLSGPHVTSNALNGVSIPSPFIYLRSPFLWSSSIYLKFFFLFLLLLYFIWNFYVLKLEKDFLYLLRMS